MFAWISLPKTTGKMAGWRLDPAPRQCAHTHTHTHFTSCAAVFGQTRHHSVAAATILTRSRTVWLFPIPKALEISERIWGNGGNQTKFDEDTIRHPERGVRKMFPTVAETLGEVCSCGVKLCWRQLGLKPRKLYLLHVLWSVRILFGQTTYNTSLLIIRSVHNGDVLHKNGKLSFSLVSIISFLIKRSGLSYKFSFRIDL